MLLLERPARGLQSVANGHGGVSAVFLAPLAADAVCAVRRNHCAVLTAKYSAPIRTRANNRRSAESAGLGIDGGLNGMDLKTPGRWGYTPVRHRDGPPAKPKHQSGDGGDKEQAGLAHWALPSASVQLS